jgi:succinate-semialdehyde dehydrogenase / glutarate-semialdehyde dehydrogenase
VTPALQAGIYDQFSKAVVQEVNKFKLGDGLVDGTTLGPLISPAAVDRVRLQKDVSFGETRRRLPNHWL